MDVADPFLVGGVRGYLRGALVAGEVEIPVLDRVALTSIPTEITAFNDLNRSESPSETGIHFYKYDYTFAGILMEPARFAPKVSNFKAIFTPDLTLGAQMPVWMRAQPR